MAATHRGGHTGRRWRLLPPAPPGLAGRLGLPALQTQLLFNRGLSERHQVETFLDPDLARLHDPFLLPDMDRAVHRLLRAALSGEAIAIYGDFDTDGLCATALLCRALYALGARVLPHIPHRVSEGHGLNLGAIASLKERGASVLVTVDCGIADVPEVEAAAAAGMDVIITDHHVPPVTVPPACAVVSPSSPSSHYPFSHLAGVGLAFKLAQALSLALSQPLDTSLLELAALGTIADVAPLLGENRILARLGLDALQKTGHPGLRALMDVSGAPPETMDEETVSFALAPRLNAAGRLESPYPSLHLLLTKDEVEARSLAAQLEGLNRERQRLTDCLLVPALGQAQEQVEGEALLFVAGEEFLPGINGLVANKLVECFHRPAVVVALDGDVARASARSIPEYNMAEALRRHAGLFLRFGGHAAAAGFTARASELRALKERLQGDARNALPLSSLTPSLDVDAEVTFRELVGPVYRLIESMAPFGSGNMAPVFVTRNVRVAEVRPAGASGQHLRLKLWQGGATWDAIAFNFVEDRAAQGDVGLAARLGSGPVDVAYRLGVDFFSGEPMVRLLVVDLRPAGPGA